MPSLRQTAFEFEQNQTRNIADLDKVKIDSELLPRTYKESTPEEFTINVISVEGVDYRVPNSVISDLKAILETRPDVEFVKVTKSGAGLQTRYRVDVL